MIRFGQPARGSARTRILAMALFVCAGGCAGPDDEPNDRPQAVVLRGETAAAPAARPVPKVVTDNRIPAPPPGAIVPQRNFTDPPLPAELQDDGGLAPLPLRPAPSAMAGEMQPTFQAPQ